MISTLKDSWKYDFFWLFFYLYKSHIRPKLAFPNLHFPALINFKINCMVLWVMAYFSLSNLLSHRYNIESLSLFYRYFYDIYWDELYSLVPPVPDTSCYFHGVESTLFPSCSKYRKKILLTFCTRTTTLCNRLLCGCFPAHINLDFFKSKFSSIVLILIIFTS